MQIFHRLRRLAAVLLLVPLSAAIQPVAAAEKTQTANVIKIQSLSSPTPTTLENVPKSVRGDMVLADDGNIYFASSAGGKGFGGIGKLAPDGTLSVVYSFVDGAEGLSAFGGLVQGRDHHLYGTTYFGGTNSTGTIFQLQLGATPVLTKLHEFGKGSSSKEPKFPYATLVQGGVGDDNLYGTTRLGGSSNRGAIFRISPAGDFSVIHSFDGSDGQEPQGSLVVGADGKLYGTTVLGGSKNRGVIYRISAAGDYERLYSFPALSKFNAFGVAINSTGANPRSGLLRSADGNFYGAAYQGGDNGYGTLYRVTVNGDSADVSTVHAFAGWPFDGAFPLAKPVQAADGSFYGTTFQGGYNSLGTVWKVAPNGASEMLHSSFGGGEDGSQLYAGVLFDATGALIGASNADNVGGAGILFKVEQATAGALPVTLEVSDSEVVVNAKATITWSAPGALTCDKFGDWNEPVAEDDPLHTTPTSGSQQVDPSIGLYTYALACKGSDEVTRNAYVALLVTAPPLETVDGGQIVGGGGVLSLLLLALFAALLFRKILKETRSSCP